MKKYRNKYRIPTARASWWDYGWNAAYFITICTKNRECWFGKIIESKNPDIPKKMDLSAMGHIANSCWYEIPHHFPFVELGAHIIMPNHVHGILIINKPNDERNVRNDINDVNKRNDDSDDGRFVVVETQNIASLQQPPQRQQPPQSQQPPTPSSPKQSSESSQSPQPPNADIPSEQSKSKMVETENDQPKNQFGPQSQNLASIIRGFKIGVTKNAREINREFAWQSRYHDHIIRDEGSYQNISKYIINNPLKWQEDKFYKT